MYWCEIAVILIIGYLYYQKYMVPNESFSVKQSVQAVASDVKSSVSSFSNTLGRKLGMGNAGEHFGTNSNVGSFDNMKQNFTSNPIGKNTMSEGYYKSSVLPI